MLASDIPTYKFPVPFANGASGTYKTVPIPTASAGASRASLADGFPSNTFLPIGSGGVPPDGRDFNGILYEVTGWERWIQAGGPIVYDATFSAAIGGYPAGAVLSTNPAGGLWLSTADNNVTNPDAAGAGWEPLVPLPADNADTIAGVSTSLFVTPAGLAAFGAHLPAGASLLQNGYYTLPGGLIVQWGRFNITGVANLVVSFPTAFPTACFSVVASGGNSTTAQDNPVSVTTGSISSSQFSVRYATSGTIQAEFIAFGN